MNYKMKKITPIIKKIRIIEQEYEICPHCREEIREKSIYVDSENYVYHSPCQDKGPIDKIKPLNKEEFKGLFGGIQTILNEPILDTGNSVHFSK